MNSGIKDNVGLIGHQAREVVDRPLGRNPFAIYSLATLWRRYAKPVVAAHNAD
jgi:hypothetical protein